MPEPVAFSPRADASEVGSVTEEPETASVEDEEVLGDTAIPSAAKADADSASPVSPGCRFKIDCE